MDTKDKNKRIEEKEKIDAEIERSLSVVKMKEAHKKIEDVEKARKKANISSIIERISFNVNLCTAITDSISDVKGRNPLMNLNRKFSDDSALNQYNKNIVATYESIRFDLQRNFDLNKEDFEKLFPKIKTDFSTYSLTLANLQCLMCQMEDMKTYCKRLL